MAGVIGSVLVFASLLQSSLAAADLEISAPNVARGIDDTSDDYDNDTKSTEDNDDGDEEMYIYLCHSTHTVGAGDDGACTDDDGAGGALVRLVLAVLTDGPQYPIQFCAFACEFMSVRTIRCHVAQRSVLSPFSIVRRQRHRAHVVDKSYHIRTVRMFVSMNE